jgi:hypothetical protein
MRCMTLREPALQAVSVTHARGVLKARHSSGADFVTRQAELVRPNFEFRRMHPASAQESRRSCAGSCAIGVFVVEGLESLQILLSASNGPHHPYSYQRDVSNTVAISGRLVKVNGG